MQKYCYKVKEASKRLVVVKKETRFWVSETIEQWQGESVWNPHAERPQAGGVPRAEKAYSESL